jgi:hypothetical protein
MDLKDGLKAPTCDYVREPEVKSKSELATKLKNDNVRN